MQEIRRNVSVSSAEVGLPGASPGAFTFAGSTSGTDTVMICTKRACDRAEAGASVSGPTLLSLLHAREELLAQIRALEAEIAALEEDLSA